MTSSASNARSRGGVAATRGLGGYGERHGPGQAECRRSGDGRYSDQAGRPQAAQQRTATPLRDRRRRRCAALAAPFKAQRCPNVPGGECRRRQPTRCAAKCRITAGTAPERNLPIAEKCAAEMRSISEGRFGEPNPKGAQASACGDAARWRFPTYREGCGGIPRVLTSNSNTQPTRHAKATRD